MMSGLDVILSRNAHESVIFEKMRVSPKQEIEALKALSGVLSETGFSNVQDRAAFKLAGTRYIEDDDERELFLLENPEEYQRFVDAKTVVESAHDRLMGGLPYRNALPKMFSTRLASKQQGKIPRWAKWAALGGLALVLGITGITTYQRREGGQDKDNDGLTNDEERMYGTEINVPNPVFKYAIKDKKIPSSIAKPLTALDKSGLNENTKAFVDELAMLQPNAQQYLINLGLHNHSQITAEDLARLRDLDQDGMPNEFERQIGTDMLRPSIYPFLNKVRQAIKNMIPKLFTVESDFDSFQKADTSTIQKTLDWINALSESDAIGSCKAHIADAHSRVSEYQKVQEGTMKDFVQLSKIWSDPNTSQEVKLKTLREYNQSHISETVVDYDSAKGTLPWHINNNQEAELQKFNGDQLGQYLERVVTFGKEGIGEAMRLAQILGGGGYVLDSTKLPSQLFLKYHKNLTQPINVPGHVQLVDLQTSMKEVSRQLNLQLNASSQDISNLGRFWTDIEDEYVIQPQYRSALSRLYGKMGSSKDSFKKSMETNASGVSGLEIAKLNYILNEAKSEDIDLIATVVVNALKTGKNLAEICDIATGLIHELSYGREKAYGMGEGFSKRMKEVMIEVCSQLPPACEKLSDSQLYYEIMKTSAFPEPEKIYYRDARRLLSGILSLNGRSTFSTVAYKLNEQLIGPFATLPTIHENGEYLWTNAWKDAANIKLLKVQRTANEFPYDTFLITQPLFGGYHSIIKATYLSKYR
jgi:hypothetical protein